MRKKDHSSVGFGLLLLVLASCGGGTVTIAQKPGADGLVPPGPLLAKLEQSLENPAEVQKLLSRMTGPDANRFDWQLFWKELSERGFRKQLYRRYRDLVVSLHLWNCNAFPEFVTFLLSVDADLDPLLSENRQCHTPLNPSIVLEVVRLIEKQHATLETSRLEQALNLVKLEMELQDYRVGWKNSLAMGLPSITSIGRELIRREASAAYSLLVVRIHEKFGASFGPTDFVFRILENESALRVWFKSFTFQKGLSTLLSLVTQHPSDGKLLSGAQADNLQREMSNGLCSHPDDNTFFDVFVNAVSLVKGLTKDWPLSERLLYLDKVLTHSEHWLSQLSSEPKRREALLTDALQRLSGMETAPHTFWLVQRFSEDQSPATESVREMAAAKTEFFEDDLDKVFWHLVQIRNVIGIVAKQRAVDDLCSFFQKRRIPDTELTEAGLREALEAGLSPGCHRLSIDKALSITSDAPLKANLGSVLNINYKSSDDAPSALIQLEAPEIRLSAVLLNQTHTHQRQVQTPTPPHANALTFPLLMGFEIPAGIDGFSKGTHFFVYHHVVKQADSGEEEPEIPLEGMKGPDLVVSSILPVLSFPFVSVGGPGQMGPEVRQGGRGDRSFLDFEHISDWLQAKVESGRLEVKAPVTLENELNLDVLSRLTKYATTNSAGLPQIYVVPDYFEELGLEQRAKIRQDCERRLGISTGDKLSLKECFSKSLVPEVWKSLADLVENSNNDGRILTADILPELDPLKVFSVSEGVVGPHNKNGPWGQPGKLKLEPKHQED